MTIINQIRKELKQNSDKLIKESTLKFFKEKVNVYGMKSALVKNIGKKYYKDIKNKNKNEIFNLCEKLWQSGYMEESFIACNWSYNLHKDYEPADIKIFEKWIHNYVNNWASCDTLCNHTVGAYIEMYPENISYLKKWTNSKNRWMRRASAVSLIVPAKQGHFLKDIFEIAETLLIDKDDMVQKGYGWMLKVASNKQQKEIFDFVIKKKQLMPRTALRYAIEKMPEKLKIKAMEK